MLTLHPGPAQPVRQDAGGEELLALWRGLDRDGRRLVLAHARAVPDVPGRRNPNDLCVDLVGRRTDARGR